MNPLRKPFPIASAAAVLTVCTLAVIDWPLEWRSQFWTWLGQASDGAQETNSTTLRNFGFIIAGLVALVFAYWRSIVADKQAKASELQAQTSQRSLLNERYQKGAEMLGNDVLAVRLGGIYALQHLAKEFPEEYHIQVMTLFCAFVCNPNVDPTEELRLRNTAWISAVYLTAYLPADRLAVLDVISGRSDDEVAIELVSHYRLNLRKTNLREVHWTYRNLQNIDFSNSDLTHSLLWGSRFDGSIFRDTNLSGAAFAYGGESAATGLGRSTINCGYSDKKTPPLLKGVIDVETGKELHWQGIDLPPGNKR